MKRILAAVDGSERQAGVLRATIALARSFGAKIVLVRVVGMTSHLPAAAFDSTPDAVPALLEQEAREELRRIEREVPEELRLPSRVDLGTPWQSIDRIAKEEDVDLIVVGSHGFGGLDHVLGTTAAKVVNHADRSVLVVRGDGRIQSQTS
jgi:nucleotide-binding universal stress UspA family protein